MATPPAVPNEAILIVEDDAAVRQVLEAYAKSIGARPEPAATVAEAKALAEKHTFAVALIDKNLGADNGIEFLAWLRNRQPDCDAIVITGYGNAESIVEALRLGAADYLQKPFHAVALKRRISLLLEHKRMRTERKVLEAQLLQADRLSALGTLAAGVVHEVNNPLTYVMLGLDLISETLEGLSSLPPADFSARVGELAAMVGDLRIGTDQMASVVRNIKTFARSDTARSGRTDLKAVLEGVLKMSKVLIRQRAQLIEELGAAPAVDGHESQLAQVFLNLVVNATQAIPEGQASQHRITVRLATSAAGAALVEVTDTGGGMPPEVLGRLFEPFFTTKPRGTGTGIGLTICKNIITAHGGSIAVKSAIGQGSTFTVTLPPIASRPISSSPTPVPAGSSRRRRVLVIDDEVAVGSALVRLLSGQHDVTCDTSGRGALERIKAGARFDVILCDLMMPEVTGPQFHDALSRLDPALASRVLFLTAGAFSESVREFADEHAERVLTKPFDLAELRRRIDAVGVA